MSIRRIEQFWKRVLLAPPGHPIRRYAALSTRNNCNGVVVDALLEGGLGIFMPPPNNFVFQDARTLVGWVQKATRRIDEMNAAHRQVMRDVRDDLQMHRINRTNGPDRTVPTVEQWKKASDEGIAFYARRREQVAQIDTYLRLYHRGAQEGNRGAQIGSLLMVQWQIYSHLAQKPNSDRRRAVLGLAARVHGALEDLLTRRDQDDVGVHFDREPDYSSSDEGIYGEVR